MWAGEEEGEDSGVLELCGVVMRRGFCAVVSDLWRRNATHGCTYRCVQVQAPLMMGEVPKCRHGHTASVVGVSLIVFGGFYDHQTTDEMYWLNTATLRW